MLAAVTSTTAGYEGYSAARGIHILLTIVSSASPLLLKRMFAETGVRLQQGRRESSDYCRSA